MKMKNYQKDAIAELFSRCMKLLRQGGKRMVFKSPTGSGKTVMMAELLKRLADPTKAKARPLSFIWAAPRQLHKQSHDKLARYYGDSCALDCAYFGDLSNKEIGENQILFFNWESVVKKSAVIVRDNERDFNLSNVVKNTREDGRDIVLIIDESHYHATTALSRELIDSIDSALVLDVSATPTLGEYNDMFEVALEDVKAEGMIKKFVVINEGFKNILTGNQVKLSLDKRRDAFVLEQALAKREQLAKAFPAKSDINPLLCVQLSDFRTEDDKSTYHEAVETLAKQGITADNGKLAIRMQEDSINWEGISKNNDTAEVLIFKHAIALGWDCPRAHILVLFRQWSSDVFSVQTLGRIMRMPEPEIGHYPNEILNAGYVYTNLPEVDIKEDIAGGSVHIHTARRIDGYDSLALPSVHRLRQRERTRLSPDFITIFLAEAKKYKLAEQINLKNQQVQSQFITDYKADAIDGMTGETIPGGVSVDVSNEEDLQRMFDYFARKVLAAEPSFHPEVRSICQVETAIQEFFGGPLEMGYADHFPEIVKITLSDDNRGHFVVVIRNAKIAYSAETEKREEQLKPTPKWEVPETATYNENYREDKAAKSVMQPFFVARQSEPEEKFIKLLEKSKKVKWWYKNGAGDSRYFAVPYSEDGEEHPFYVDFIVRFTDGRIGLYDPKDGFTIDKAKEKSDGLLAYVKKHGQKGQLVGGIVTPVKIGDSDEWMIYPGAGKDLNSKDLSNWEPLEF